MQPVDIVHIALKRAWYSSLALRMPEDKNPENEMINEVGIHLIRPDNSYWKSNCHLLNF